ncbi:MAG TPA: DUF2459 domain-containing protein [Campylobacterales bacterium]|nr:DUF2459 domain-containing protein [Campylobacterales bacterium]
MKKIFKYFFYLIFSLLSIVGLYFFVAYIFIFFPKTSSKEIAAKHNIHILYSKIHSDIVFNIKDINLSRFSEFKEKTRGYIAFGWGDKEVYLNTPEISNIQISSSLKAFFINTPSLMHVSYLPNISRYKDIKQIKLSSIQKKYLLNSIIKSFNFKGETYNGYGREDFFYDAKDNYNFINTCNTWTGDRLRESNVSMPYWTPFVWSVTSPFP